MFILIYYVPVADHESVKQALFASGAGNFGAYDQCCWQLQGSGQFRPLKGSQPTIGKLQELTRLEEFRVEITCSANNIKTVVKTLLEVHPYEQPAYHVIKALTYRDL